MEFECADKGGVRWTSFNAAPDMIRLIRADHSEIRASPKRSDGYNNDTRE
jgi:hypothetical protein